MDEKIEQLAKELKLIKELQASDIYTANYQEAKALFSLGYRKESDTAKEILQVVSKIMFELFGNEPPCNFNCNDEYMFDNCNDYCNKNCGKNVYEKCWKEFFIAKLKANGVEVEE